MPEWTTNDVVDDARKQMQNIIRLAADELADAAEKLGDCGSHDVNGPYHYKNCARCAVKRAARRYRQVTQ